jgi:hypothetical protein
MDAMRDGTFVTLGLLMLAGCATAPEPGQWMSMYPEDHEPDRAACVSESVGRRTGTPTVSGTVSCTTWVGDRFVTTTCRDYTQVDDRKYGLIEDDFLDCMASRGHFHTGSKYNIAQPLAYPSSRWTCRDAVRINCEALARSHQIRNKERSGVPLSDEERQFKYDQERERIKEKQRALGMIP